MIGFCELPQGQGQDQEQPVKTEGDGGGDTAPQNDEIRVEDAVPTENGGDNGDKTIRKSTVGPKGTQAGDANPDSARTTARSGGTGKKLQDFESPPPKIELNAKQKKDIRDAFDAFDSKGTGQMEARELKVIEIIDSSLRVP